MNSYSILIVNEHIQYLLDEAAAHRAANVERRGLFERIASAASSVKSAIGARADNGRSILPTLSDHSYRS